MAAGPAPMTRARTGRMGSFWSYRIGSLHRRGHQPNTTWGNHAAAFAGRNVTCAEWPACDYHFIHMKFPKLAGIKRVLQKGRQALGRGRTRAVGDARLLIPGQFQTYSYTLPDRYPWLFQFAAESLAKSTDLHLLSFGCSRGDEVFALRKYFPTAVIKGIDIDPRNIEYCQSRMRGELPQKMLFATAPSVEAEADASFDAIFCLAVLCRGDLTASNAQCSAPGFLFEHFEIIVADLARCVKPGGLLFLLTTNFRFCDTASAANFDTVLEAAPSQLADDVLFDSSNRLMAGVRYPSVGFRKRYGAGSMGSSA
jgi:SAM-dependent methyltransferase